MGFRAQVVNGRIVLDEPTDLPEGSVVDLVLDEGSDSLDDADRELLHASLREGFEQFKRGEFVSAEDVLQVLRSKARCPSTA